MTSGSVAAYAVIIGVVILTLALGVLVIRRTGDGEGADCCPPDPGRAGPPEEDSRS